MLDLAGLRQPRRLLQLYLLKPLNDHGDSSGWYRCEFPGCLFAGVQSLSIFQRCTETFRRSSRATIWQRSKCVKHALCSQHHLPTQLETAFTQHLQNIRLKAPTTALTSPSLKYNLKHSCNRSPQSITSTIQVLHTPSQRSYTDIATWAVRDKGFAS